MAWEALITWVTAGDDNIGALYGGQSGYSASELTTILSGDAPLRLSFDNGDFTYPITATMEDGTYDEEAGIAMFEISGANDNVIAILDPGQYGDDNGISFDYPTDTDCDWYLEQDAIPVALERESAGPTPSTRAVNKVVYGNTTLIDLTGDTITASDLRDGVTAHTRSGEQVTGTLEVEKQTTWYGTCSTGPTTAQKAVVCADFVLETGAFSVLFTKANTAATPTLNVNSTGAKSIYIGGSTPNSTSNTLKWSANTLITFVYDGTYYRYISARAAATVISPDGAGSWYGISSTTASARTKTSTVENYRLMAANRVAILFTTANTYQTGPVALNINSTGAKDIWYNGVITGQTNPLLWSANTLIEFAYNGIGYCVVSMSSADTLGGVRIGSGLSISNGVLSAEAADYVTESGTSGNWTYRKWLSGRAECWMEYDLYVSSWANWGSVYESGQAVPATAFPSGLFAATPAPNVSLRNSSTGVGIMGFETTGGQGSATTSMPLYLMRATSTGAATFQLYVRFDGRWQ